MNRIYRSIWNQATGAYAAVSENVNSAGKRSLPGSGGTASRFILTSMAAALMLGYGSLALAGPAGGTVVAGQATINGTPGSTVIKQGSQNAVINWANFNINKGESVQFVQPNSNAVALNRVLGSDGTTILGNLSANGKVFIVNPNGVLFGLGASVNTAGLVASTLDINNADFMAGKYQFSGNGTGKVLNQGSISAPGGYVALLGANVSNEGTIQARLGSVALAAGRAITLDVAGDGLLNVAVNAGAVGALVNNGGLIRADGGSVVLTAQAAGDLLKTVVNNTGVIEAQTIDTRSGTIKLLGDMQSGTVNAGGTLDASAPLTGNGGFIDTSAAHVKIDDALKVTTAAPKGLTGMWLIDPSDFNIAVSGGDMTGASVSNALKTTDLRIESIAGAGGTQGNINVNDNVNWSANKLTLTAQNNININKAMRGSGTASLALEYGQSGVAAGNLATYNVKAEVDLPSGNNFSTRQGKDGVVINYTVINSVGAAGSLSGADFQGMNANLMGNYALGRNIDASATVGWDSGKGFVPIGNKGTPFMGRVDGLGHDITGLSLTRLTDYVDVGMFGAIGTAGVVRNLNLVNTRIQAPEGMYGQIRLGMLAAHNAGLIDNVSAYGELKLVGAIYAGGLVGVNTGVINNSRSSGSIDHSPNYAGGAAGLVAQNEREGRISNSSSSMTVTVVKGTAGGLVLENGGAINKSFAKGDVTGDVFTGGLVAFTSGNISDSYASGSVTGSSIAGGLVGRTGGAISNSYATGNVYSSGDAQSEQGFGGLAGDIYGGRVSNSYATGSVNAGNYAGGIVGRNMGTVENVYSFGAVNAQHDNQGGIVGYNDSWRGSVSNAYYNSSANHGVNGVGQGNGRVSNIVGLNAGVMGDPASYPTFNFTTTAGATGNSWVTVGSNGGVNGKGGTLPMFSSEYSTTINSPHQLQLMAMDKAAAYTLGSSFSAAATAGGDIWLGNGFVPVGDGASAFTGSLDGGGHIISDLYIFRQGDTAVGLIGSLGKNGRIADLGLSDARIRGGSDVGGLAGTSAGKISGSFVTGNVTGDAQVGALVGSNTGEIINSYAAGSATGGVNVGGLAGDSHGGSIRNSYAAVAVSGEAGLGGLAGGASAAPDVTGSYWDTQISGQASSQGGTGLRSAELKNRANYNGAGSPAWDLNNIWVIYDGQSTPLLRSFMTPLVVTVASGSKVYDGLAADPVTASYSRVVDPSLLQGSLTYDNVSGSPVNAGNYVVRASGMYSTAQNGYLITYVDGGLTITPRQISLDGASAGSKVYDGNTSAILHGGSLSGVLDGDLASLSFLLSGAYASKNAGDNLAITVAATLGGSAAGNYTLAAVGNLTGTISKATISGVTGMRADDKVYDGNTYASLSGASAVLHGMVSGDSLAVVLAKGRFADKNAGSGKMVHVSDIVLAGADSGNYTLAARESTTTGTITPAVLMLGGVVAQDKIYDGNTAVHLTGGMLAGLIGADKVILSSLSGVFADKNVGNGKAVSVAGVLASDTALASNYTLRYLDKVTANITPATISGIVNLRADGKVYDGGTAATLSAHSGSFTGRIGDDELSFRVGGAAFSDKNAGIGKTVHVGGITLSGADAGNYVLASSSATATADITPKVLTLDAVTAGNKTYDGNATASLSGGTLSGLVGRETLDVTGMQGHFDDKNAGAGKRVTVSGAALLDTASGLASNYVLADPTGLSASITPKALTLAGIVANNKVYDGTSKASVSGAILSGLVEMETLELAGLSAVFADKHAGKDKAVTVTGATLLDTAHGLASNYTLGNPTGLTAEINRAVIGGIGGIKAGNKVYDGNSSVLLDTRGASFYGMVAGDSLGLASASGVFSDKNAASGKTVHIGGLALSGADAGNYVLGSDVASTTADIAARSLTLSGVVAGDKVYDGNRHASVSGGVLSGLVAGESVGLAGQTGSFGDKNVGNGKAVVVTGTTLLDTASGLASNYVVAEPTGLTASITPKALTLAGIVADNKVYDGNTVASLSGGSLSGLVDSETLGFAGLSGKFSDKHAGKDKAVTVKGATLLSTASGAAGNYTLSDPTGLTASITPATLTVSITAGNKVYDATANASVSWRDDRLAGDQLSVVGNAAQFVDKQAGQGKLVSMEGIRLSGLDAGNYVVNARATTRADIARAQLTVTANNAEKGQGRPNPVFDASYAGWLAGDSVASELNGSLLFDTLAGTASPSGTYQIAASGLTSNNYAIRYVDGTLKVKPTEAVQSAVTAAVAAVSAVPRAGNMVVAEHARGVENKATTSTPAAPVMAGVSGAVSRNVLPGLQLSVLERGILLPAELSTAMP